MNRPVRHHFVPVHILNAFVSPAIKKDLLWVLDATQRKPYQSSPIGCGYVNNFNRVDPDSHPDPMAVETFYAEIENKTAPVIHSMRETGLIPVSSDRNRIPILIAHQITRSPRFRRRLDGFLLGQMENEWLNYTRNKASRRRFAQRQRKNRLPEHCESSEGCIYNLWSPEGYIDHLKCGDYSITTDNNWKMKIANDAMLEQAKILEQREWSVHRFDGSAEPLVIGDAGVGFVPISNEGPQAVGLQLQNTVVYLPISQNQVLVGVYPRAKKIIDRALNTVALNTTSFAWSESQCFSSTQDFTIDDPDRGRVLWSVYAAENSFPKLASDPGDLATEYYWNR